MLTFSRLTLSIVMLSFLIGSRDIARMMPHEHLRASAPPLADIDAAHAS